MSFDGCSWLMVYHLGVATALVDRLGFDALDHVRFCGASCGSLVAAALVARVDMGAFRCFVYDMLDIALGRFMGPVGCMTSFVEGGLRLLMPQGSYKRANGRLLVSISKMGGIRPSVGP
jgi:patatin-like phospholipase domain-containing protein 4